MTTKIQECRHSSPIYRICVQQGIYNFNLIFEKGKNIFKIKLELRRCSTFIFLVFQEFIKKKRCFLSESAYSYQRTKKVNFTKQNGGASKHVNLPAPRSVETE